MSLSRLRVLIVAPVVLVTVLAAGLSAFLNYGKFAVTLAEQENARFGLVAQGVKAGLEANLNLGLQLNGLTVAQEILDRERRVVHETQSVVVFAADGAILFSSGKAHGIARPPADWLRHGDWSSEAADWRAVGTSLVNPFGVVVGGVAVLYPRESRDRALAAMERKLFVAAGWAALVAALASLLGVGYLLQRAHAHIEALAQDLAPGSAARDDDAKAVKTTVTRAHAAIAELSAALPPQEKSS